MHHINSSYTTYINVKRKRSGHLLQGRYKAIVIDKDSYLLELSRYLHLNPVRVNVAEKPEDYSYSSYSSYITDRKDGLVSRSEILEMFSEEQSEARRRYKTFVEDGIREQKQSPMTRVYAGMLLGGEDFIRSALERIEGRHLENEDVSHRKALSRPLAAESVLSAVCRYYGISRQEIDKSENSEPRKIFIYLAKKHAVATTREISSLLREKGYAATAKMYQRTVKDLAVDKDLRGRVEEIRETMSNVEG
jgi:hypothetical protein